jgi:hypothetical protein
MDITGRRRCEIFPESARTFHAKAQSRRGAKETNHLFSTVFASWRLCVRLSIFSQLRMPVPEHGRDGHGTFLVAAPPHCIAIPYILVFLANIFMYVLKVGGREKRPLIRFVPQHLLPWEKVGC